MNFRIALVVSCMFVVMTTGEKCVWKDSLEKAKQEICAGENYRYCGVLDWADAFHEECEEREQREQKSKNPKADLEAEIAKMEKMLESAKARKEEFIKSAKAKKEKGLKSANGK